MNHSGIFHRHWVDPGMVTMMTIGTVTFITQQEAAIDITMATKETAVADIGQEAGPVMTQMIGTVVIIQMEVVEARVATIDSDVNIFLIVMTAIILLLLNIYINDSIQCDLGSEYPVNPQNSHIGQHLYMGGCQEV